MDLDANGNPTGIISDQLITNTHTSPFLNVKIGNQAIDDELVITYGSNFRPSYFNNTTYSMCTSTNPSSNKLSIFRRSSGTYSAIYNSGGSNLYSQGVTIPGTSITRKVIYAKNSCDYWAAVPGTFNTLNIINYHPTSGYNELGNPTFNPHNSIIPKIDLHYNGKYSLLAVGDAYGRNRNIRIFTISQSGSIDKEENIIESNVYQCIGFTPSACTNGSVFDADFYANTLSISQDKLIVGAFGTGLTFNGITYTAPGSLYIYKKKGTWGLDKIINGLSGESIGRAIASSNDNYVFSSTVFNLGQGKVFIGEW